jgi:putative lipoprotein
VTPHVPYPGRALLALVLAGWAAGCGPGQSTAVDGGIVRGSVTHRERVALPPDAVVEVKLYDVSNQDGAAPIIAQTTVVPAGREVPLAFELRYDPRTIRPIRWYAVRATIRSGGQLTFATDTAHRVITQGHPTQLDLRLVRVGPGPDMGAAAPARAQAIRADLAGYRAVHGTSAAGERAAAWTAYFDGTILRCIDETSNEDHEGATENEYYFEGGALIAYMSRASRVATDPARPRGLEQVTLRLAFDASGAQMEQSKMVDGRPVPIDMNEVAGARARAALLAAEASLVRSTRPADPPPEN